MVNVSPEPDDVLAQTVLLVQRSLNKLGADPQLVEDGKNGPRAKCKLLGLLSWVIGHSLFFRHLDIRHSSFFSIASCNRHPGLK